MKLPDIPENRTKAGPGVVISCRIPEEFSDLTVALERYCEEHKRKRNWVIAAALTEYLKNHGGAR